MTDYLEEMSHDDCLLGYLGSCVETKEMQSVQKIVSESVKKSKTKLNLFQLYDNAISAFDSSDRCTRRAHGSTGEQDVHRAICVFSMKKSSLQDVPKFLVDLRNPLFKPKTLKQFPRGTFLSTGDSKKPGLYRMSEWNMNLLDHFKIGCFVLRKRFRKAKFLLDLPSALRSVDQWGYIKNIRGAKVPVKQ